MTYSEKLRDPRWQKKRLEAFNRWGFRCLECGDQKSHLQIHHRYYVAGRMPWDYPTDCLTPLCEDCHRRENAKSSVREWELLIACYHKLLFEGKVDFRPMAVFIESAQRSGIAIHEFVYLLQEAINKGQLSTEMLIGWKNEREKEALCVR